MFKLKKKGRIIIITGCAGIGKTTISTILCKKLKKCVYISVDSLRENVISGYEFPAKMKWKKETFLQSSLARKSALYIAKLYADAEFDVVVDDAIYGENVDIWLTSFSKYPLFLFCLQANLQIIMNRNMRRKAGKLHDEVVKYLFEKFEIFKQKHSSDPRIIVINNQGVRSIAINKIINSLTQKIE